MTVVNHRDTLIAWYQRRGYQLTGELQPFPYDDTRFGTPRRPDLAFAVLEKALTPTSAQPATTASAAANPHLGQALDGYHSGPGTGTCES